MYHIQIALGVRSAACCCVHAQLRHSELRGQSASVRGRTVQYYITTRLLPKCDNLELLEQLAQAWLAGVAAVAAARVTARQTGVAHHDASFRRYTSDCAVSLGTRVVRIQSVTSERKL